jgi:hypothetical protein
MDQMIITARFAAQCPTCRAAIAAGAKIEWSKGSPARHAACAAGSSAAPTAPAGRIVGRMYDPSKFNGYGARRGGYTRTCKTGGDCSSFGSGRSCGAPDCDGY